jgi:hypothetical protein
MTMAFDPNKSGRFQPYREDPHKAAKIAVAIALIITLLFSLALIIS